MRIGQFTVDFIGRAETGAATHWPRLTYEGWNFNSGNYLFATDTK